MPRALARTLLVSLTLAVGGPAFAAEPVFEFLDALRNDKQGVLAIEYLNQLKASNRVSPDLQEVFDLEMARNLQVAADETVNEGEAAKYRRDAQTAIDAFLKAHPDHSESGFAFDTYGNLSMDRGNQLSRQANVQKDATRKTQLFDEARKEYLAARPRFDEAVKRFRVRLDDADAEVKAALEQTKEKRGNTKFKRAAVNADQQRYIAENDWLNARFKLAMLDYYTAQTYPDAKNPDAAKALKAASAGLDQIFQGYREARPGVLAHFWHGMATKQLGDKLTAEDIFDEVIAKTPSGGQVDPTEITFYTEAVRQKLLLLSEKQKIDDIIGEGESYLKFQRMRTDPWYGVAVEVAKAYVAKGLKLPQGNERKKIMTEAVGTLREATKKQSGYHREATALLSKYAPEVGQEASANTFNEAVSVADIAMQSGDPKGAVESYLKALELAKKEKETDEHKARVEIVRYQLANARYSAQDYEGAYTDGLALAKGNKDAKVAPPSAVLAIQSALASFGTAQDKASAQQKLLDAVNYTVQTWPNRAEADDARIALGRLKAVQGDLAAAMQTFGAVNPASDRYPQALQMSAQAHWKLYVDGRRMGSKDAAVQEHRDTAVKQLEQSVKLLEEKPSLATQMPQVATEVPLLLAEIRLDEETSDQAIVLLTPLVTKLQADEAESLDLTGIRILVSAIRGYQQQKKAAEASTLGLVLLQKGQDIPPVNTVLAGVSQNLRSEYKLKAEEARKAGPENAAAQAMANQAKETLDAFLGKLAGREKLGLQEIIVLGDTAADTGDTELAKKLYNRALETARAGGNNPRLQSAVNRVQAQVIGLLRAEKKYDDALREVDLLIQSVPKALEPRVEKARILAGMADSEPDVAKWKASTDNWAQLRNMMQGMQKKPAEYYEAVYETARGLFEQSKLSSSQKEANDMKAQARQLLKATSALAPNLSGPDMVGRYDALMSELQ
ncbi:hypothetical protein [Planctomyces sp. SH-PL14]|uniref:hypothetical protein n=1 Tax=Planctomyces sp. SH-PL14 TaxID=1632864 RepID=UPI00078DCBE0|nr:hypothetical protein [Planctomyces sp. SH-PL14]AMV21605.1 hypothetical protein VT03_27125 [Planctomyces sp. SH-PL14]